MPSLKRSLIGRILTILAVCLMVLVPFQGAALADPGPSETKIKHDPVTNFLPGRRMEIDALVTDPAGIKAARLYFRAAGQENFVYSPMWPGEGDAYHGIIPAVAEPTNSVQYLIFVVNENNVVVRTSSFKVENIGTGASVPSPSDKPMTVFSEAMLSDEEARKGLPGFSDDITVEPVAPSSRYGVVAGGLYRNVDSTSENPVPVSAPASLAKNGGTIQLEEGGGVSTTAYILGGIGAAAAVVGLAAAAGGGGGGGGGGGSAPSDTPTVSVLDAPATATRGQIYTAQLSFTDPNSDVAEVSLFMEPAAGGQFAIPKTADELGIAGAASGLFNWSGVILTGLPEGTASFYWRITDAEGHSSDSGRITVTVE